MDPSGMMNEGAPFNLSEIWQFPMNGVSTGDSFADSSLTTAATGHARVSHALSQAVIEGISRAWKRGYESESAKVVSTSNCNGADECENKRQRQKIDEVVCGNKAEAGSPETNMDQKKQQLDLKKDYIHVRARRGQATDSHSLAERARREKISERMKILQDLVPGCNKVMEKHLF